NFKNIVDGLIHVAQTNVTASFANIVQESHDHTQPCAGNILKTAAIDYDPVLFILQEFLNRNFKILRRVSIDQSNGLHDRSGANSSYVNSQIRHQLLA